MSVTIKLKQGLTPKAEQWLMKNVGPKLHYLHNSIGGVGWLAKRTIGEPQEEGGYSNKYWTLTFQEDSYASWFRIIFPDD